jgi:hypothetical protein
MIAASAARVAPPLGTYPRDEAKRAVSCQPMAPITEVRDGAHGSGSRPPGLSALRQCDVPGLRSGLLLSILWRVRLLRRTRAASSAPAHGGAAPGAAEAQPARSRDCRGLSRVLRPSAVRAGGERHAAHPRPLTKPSAGSQGGGAPRRSTATAFPAVGCPADMAPDQRRAGASFLPSHDRGSGSA